MGGGAFQFCFQDAINSWLSSDKGSSACATGRTRPLIVPLDTTGRRALEVIEHAVPQSLLA